MIVRLQITEDDIYYGAPGSETACPIALSLRRIVSPECRVEVGDTQIVYRAPGGAMYVRAASNKTTRFVTGFDRTGGAAKPTRIAVDIPEEVLTCRS